MKKSILFLMLLNSVFFNGCDTFGSYDYYIDNRSDSTLLISYRWLNKLESKTILPHTTLLVETFETNNGLCDYNDRLINEYFDTIIISLNKLPIKKNINLRKNWHYTIDKKNYKNIYKFEVENMDIR